MISLYTGTPGSGKSYHAVSLALKMLRVGKFVIANFALSFTPKQLKKGFEQRFYYMPNEKITINELIIFALDKGMIDKAKESQAVVIIDEAGGRFNCRDFKNSDRAEWIDFFSQHRKLGFDFVLVAQNDRMLDRQIRGYLETEVKHRKINNFGPFWMVPFPVFVCIEYWYTAKQKVESYFMLFRKKVAAQYDSMKMFSGFKLSKEMLRRIEEKKFGLPAGGHDPALDTNINVVFTEEKD